MSHLQPPVGPADHAQGRDDAPVTLVEYGDFQCPYCGAAYPELKSVQRALGDSLRFVFRNFPLMNMHPHALHAAEFAEAAASIGRFWEMHDLLFEHQQALDDRSLIGYGAMLHFTPDLAEAALRGEFDAKIQGDITSGARSGVNGTPTLFINGQRFDGPAKADVLIEVLTGLVSG